jgi:hypothetical protein
VQPNRRKVKRKSLTPGHKTKTRTKVRVLFIKQEPRAVVKPGTYWPDRLDYIKAIAARGLTDAEMADYLQISPDLLDSWKTYYPLFEKAIEEGRTSADAEVVAALHKNAVGFEYETQEVVRLRDGSDVVDVCKYMPPDTNAQKFWLTNRSPHWRAGQSLAIGGQRGAPAIGVSVESKQHVIHSILNMITPRPDGDGKPGKLIEIEPEK